jgi:hypothetical protein
MVGGALWRSGVLALAAVLTLCGCEAVIGLNGLTDQTGGSSDGGLDATEPAPDVSETNPSDNADAALGSQPDTDGTGIDAAADATPELLESGNAGGGLPLPPTCGDANVCVVGGILSVGGEAQSSTSSDGTPITMSNPRLEPVATVCDPAGFICVTGGIEP